MCGATRPLSEELGSGSPSDSGGQAKLRSLWVPPPAGVSSVLDAQELADQGTSLLLAGYASLRNDTAKSQPFSVSPAEHLVLIKK